MNQATLTRSESWSLLTLAGASVAVIFNTFQGDGAPLVASLAFSGLAFSVSYAFIRWLGPTMIKANLKGKDMSKHVQREMCVFVLKQNPTRTLTNSWLVLKQWELLLAPYTF